MNGPLDEVKLLPCLNPWCERVLPPQAIRYTGGTPQTYPWSVRCTDCHLRGPSCKTEAEAIALWNSATRPPIGTDEVVERRSCERVTLNDRIKQLRVERKHYFDCEGDGVDLLLIDIQDHFDRAAALPAIDQDGGEG